MGRKTSLQQFLRRDIIKNQIRPPSPPDRANPVEVYEKENDSPANDDSIFSDNDSLFGESILTKKERSEEQLREFLSKPRIQISSFNQVSSEPKNADLAALKDELKILVSHTEQAGSREKKLFWRQRSALIEEIIQIQTLTKEEDSKRIKEKNKKEQKKLPEPLSQWERRQLDLERARIKKARLLAEKPPKRKRDEELDHLDGEERLRLGLKTKRKATQLTGQWSSRIHDRVPAMGIKGEPDKDMLLLPGREDVPETQMVLWRPMEGRGPRMEGGGTEKQQSTVLEVERGMVLYNGRAVETDADFL